MTEKDLSEALQAARTQTRIASYSLVGEFFQNWAFMESEINDAIQKGLGLTELQGAVLSGNIQFRDKIHILRTLVHLTALPTPGESERIDKMLVKIADYGPTRNMFAHEAFIPLADEIGVKFLIVKAKGTINFPKIVWKKDAFHEARDKLKAWSVELQALANTLSSRNAIAAIADALMKQPNPEASGLFGLGLLDPRPLADRMSDMNLATPETEDEAPPSAGQ